MTYLELQAFVFRQMRDNFQTKYDLTTVKNNLNQAERIFCSHAEYAGTKSTTISLVASTQEYALPAGFVKEQKNSVFVDGKPIQKITQDYTIEETSQTGEPSGYYIRRKQIGFYPIPTATATITLLYFDMGGSLVNDGDVPIIPLQNHELLAMYPCIFCSLEGDDDRVGSFKSLWDDGLIRAKIDITENFAQNMVFQPGAGGPVLDPLDHDPYGAGLIGSEY
jgi:hypothetical protein